MRHSRLQLSRIFIRNNAEDDDECVSKIQRPLTLEGCDMGARDLRRRRSVGTTSRDRE